MTESTVAIVGSGPVGAALAHALVEKGHDVAVFEKGPEYPYPHVEPFLEEVSYLYANPAYTLPPDLKHVEVSGSYQHNLNDDLVTAVGGAGTRWAALSMRMLPADFRTRSRYEYGADWPLDYNDLESYYCRAESFLGVSGTDDDNPFAPPRSKPFPLPPFELSSDDVRFAAKLRARGIVLHTTPQARTRVDFGDRGACVNFGTCRVCPVGARYSPNHHLLRAAATGRCQVNSNASVRRIVVEADGRARALVYRRNDETVDREHSARVIFVAAGAIDSARLLLVSADGRHPDGLGNGAGQVGRNLLFHHGWMGRLHYRDALYPARHGAWTGQIHQFMDLPTRTRHSGLKVEFPFVGDPHLSSSGDGWRTGADVMRDLRESQHWHPFRMHSEANPGAEKYVTLSKSRDRFGDPFAHVHYELDERDRETFRFVRGIVDRIASATEADGIVLADLEQYTSTAHHMGTCRMGARPEDGVVDPFGRVHGLRNLFVVGGSAFVTTGSVNPTLTMVALALRTADYVDEQVL